MKVKTRKHPSKSAIRRKKWFLPAAFLLFAGLCAVLLWGYQRRRTPRVEINGQTWRVELATTFEQQYQGLSGRRELAEDAGMLFVYDKPKRMNYCMRGCLIPLDIAFIGADMRIIQIHTMATEPDMVGRRSYSSDGFAQFALEVPAGAFARAAVTVGQKVTFLGDIPERESRSRGE